MNNGLGWTQMATYRFSQLWYSPIVWNLIFWISMQSSRRFTDDSFLLHIEFNVPLSYVTLVYSNIQEGIKIVKRTILKSSNYHIHSGCIEVMCMSYLTIISVNVWFYYPAVLIIHLNIVFTVHRQVDRPAYSSTVS